MYLSQWGSCWFELSRLCRALRIPRWIFIVLFNFQSKQPCIKLANKNAGCSPYFTEAETVTGSRKWLHKYTQDSREAWSHFSFIFCLQIHWRQIKIIKDPRGISNTISNISLQITIKYSYVFIFFFKCLRFPHL